MILMVSCADLGEVRTPLENSNLLYSHSKIPKIGLGTPPAPSPVNTIIPWIPNPWKKISGSVHWFCHEIMFSLFVNDCELDFI